LSATISATVTLTPVPPGVNGTDSGHYLYISGVTGTAEAVLITGGTAVEGNPSGTVIFTPANNHSGAWTLSSATGGIQEAICSMSSAGGLVYVSCNATLQANVSNSGKQFVTINKPAGIMVSGSFTILGQSSIGDGRDEWFNFVTSNATFGNTGNVVNGTSPTWLSSPTPYYALLEANVNKYPVQTINPEQFISSGVLGAVNVPSGAASGNASGINGLCTTSSTSCWAVGITGFGNPQVASSRAWGANIACSNQPDPGVTTGVDSLSIIGLELDVNCFTTMSGSVTGLLIAGSASNVQPTNADAIGIISLGSGVSGQPQWVQGINFTAGSCQAAMTIQEVQTGASQPSMGIDFVSSDTSTQHISSISLAADGTFIISGGANSPVGGVKMIDGAGNVLLFLKPSGPTFLNALPVFANNAAAISGGLVAGDLYKTSTGQVMQVF